MFGNLFNIANFNEPLPASELAPNGNIKHVYNYNDVVDIRVPVINILEAPATWLKLRTVHAPLTLGTYALELVSSSEIWREKFCDYLPCYSKPQR
jgi:hypothetical protein